MKKYFSLVLITILLFTLLSIPSNASNVEQKTPIKHIINIFFENNAFDTIFGIYPDDPHSLNRNIVKNITVPDNLLGKGILHTLNKIPDGKYYAENPLEGYTSFYLDWNHGRMDNFINGSGPQSMVYFTSNQFGLEWSLASEYAMGDRYFSNYMSESAPNTLYYLAGFTPVINDYGPPPWIQFNETIFGELLKYGIPWGIYVGDRSNGTFDYSSYLSGWGNYRNHLYSWDDFVSQVRNGSLPYVSYIFTQDYMDYDQHPPNNVERGEIWLAYIVSEIERSPIWQSSLITITYDEFGGFYDHVPPPSIDNVQLGMRVPFIIISPYAKENYVSHTVMTHTSILAFIDYNWNLPALNGFVAHSNLPLDMLNFNSPYPGGLISRPPIQFPNGLNLSLHPTNVEQNFSSLFPFEPQFNLSELPYQKEGSSNITLSSLGFSIYNENNGVIMPFYYQPLFFIILLIVNVSIIAYRGEKHGK
ncbi:MAG: alkaline phosphatase family protein [Thermoplasmata archaeon]